MPIANGFADSLPVDEVLDDVVAALGENGSAVLQAPPGAGKTTRVPLALLEADWLGDQRVIMLEPRRVAARAAAARLAQSLGETVGQRVGQRMRDATSVSDTTRIEVVTEGVLTRMIQSDPSLDGVGVVVFDEFHERSLHADLGLAFAIEARAALHPDLRLLVMSATLDGQRVAAALDHAPIITSEGRQFPVETTYRPPLSARDAEAHLVEVVLELCEPGGKQRGDILVFLPGAGWIRRAEGALRRSLPDGVVVTPLYGALAGADQDRALRPHPGKRKVVLATDIAETSLTIDGVSIVVDAGQRRAPRFDTRSGLTRLDTGRISRASADQRRGRAGRQGPGACIRLWAERENEHLAPFDAPEITVSDLSGLRLQLARWGADASELTWLDAPPRHALDEAGALLRSLGAIDATDRITAHGDAMLAVGADPRLAHMLVTGRDLGLAGLACDLAGLLSGRDPLESRSVDVRERLTAMGQRVESGSVRRGTMSQARSSAARWRRRLEVGSAVGDPNDAGVLLATAFPDRVGQQRGDPGSYLLSSGRGAELPPGDPLTGEPFLAIADVDGDPRGGRVHLGAPLDRVELDRALGHRLERLPVVEWDDARGDVVSEHQTKLGALVLKREPIVDPPADALAAAWGRAVERVGLDLVNLASVDRFRDRVSMLRGIFGAEWPDLSDGALATSTGSWLVPHLHGVRRRKDLANLDVGQILGSQLAWEQKRRLDELAPTHLTVPSGSSIPIDYSDAEGPVLAVRLQELFGLTATPTVAGGRVPVVLHLLSPAGRPVQVTRDLANFWRATYPQVKAELMGRYPKHHWPEDPLTATPTNRTKRKA